MRFLKPLLACLLLLAIADLAPKGAHGALAASVPPAVEGRILQWPVPTAQTARDPVADAEGNIYFAVAGADRIARFDPRSAQFREWVLPEGTKPHGVAVGGDGKIYFGGNGNATLGELDLRTGAVRAYPAPSAASHPYSLALDADGNVWMTERTAGRVARFDRTTRTMTEYPMDGEPYGLAFDRRGLLWVTRIAAGKLGSLDPGTGKTTELFLGAGSKPRRIALAPDGMLWVSLYGTGKLVKVDPAANRVVREYPLPDGPNSGPYSVNVDARGWVWVLEFQSDSVAILDPVSEKFRVIRLPDKQSGARNANFDARGRYWYVATTTGKLGVID